MSTTKKRTAVAEADNGNERLHDEGFARKSGQLPKRSLVPSSLWRLSDGSFEAQCGRCLRFSFPVVAVSLEHAWSELINEGWTWYTSGVGGTRYASCIQCLKARHGAPIDGLPSPESGSDTAPEMRGVSSEDSQRHRRVAAMPWHVRLATVR
jgi:hypothetical protein